MHCEVELHSLWLYRVNLPDPHITLQVYKAALVEPDVYDSIISFYNKVFMQNLKNFIFQFARPVVSLFVSFLLFFSSVK